MKSFPSHSRYILRVYFQNQSSVRPISKVELRIQKCKSSCTLLKQNQKTDTLFPISICKTPWHAQGWHTISVLITKFINQTKWRQYHLQFSWSLNCNLIFPFHRTLLLPCSSPCQLLDCKNNFGNSALPNNSRIHKHGSSLSAKPEMHGEKLPLPKLFTTYACPTPVDFSASILDAPNISSQMLEA